MDYYIQKSKFSLNNYFITNQRYKPKYKINLNYKAFIINKFNALNQFISFLIVASFIIIPVLNKTESNRNFKLYYSAAKIKYKGMYNQKLVFCRAYEGSDPGLAPPQETRRNSLGTEIYNGETINIVELTWNSLTRFTYLFCGCSNIIEITLTTFSTNGISDMTAMFRDCTSLVSVTLTPQVTSASNMGQMFFGCSSLTSLDLPYLTGNNAQNIDNMFKGCISLTYLNIKNFEGRNVKRMGNMFANCKSLISLDMSNFKTTNLEYMDNVFNGCINLQYINLNQITILSNTNIDSIFLSVPKNFIICIDPRKAQKLSNLIRSIGCSNMNCSEGDWTTMQKKLSYDGNSCYDDCRSANLYEYKSRCYKTCPLGTLPNTNMMCIDCDLETNCKWCALLDAANDLCILCSEGYYELYNSSNINNTYKICYKSPKGYYLDNIGFFYKPCYPSCEECIINGNDNEHNCLSCKTDYKYEIDFLPFKNCYQECEYYHYTNLTNSKLYCTRNLKCPEEYSKLLTDLRECVIYCNQYNLFTNYSYYEFRNKCYKKCPKGLIEPKNISSYFCEPKYIYSLDNKTQLVIDIQEYLLNVFDGTEVDIGKDLEIQGKGIFVEITTQKNQKLNEKTNKTTINLGKCESILRKENNIYNKNNLFYILKMDIEEKGMKIPIIDYEVYYPTNGINLQKLNLTQCDNQKVDLSIPVQLDEDLFMHNASDEYYNNNCLRTISDSGTDISLKDRRKEFIEKNLTLCEENCDLIDYDYTTHKAKCNCKIKINLPIINDEIKIDKDKLYKSFTDVKSLFSNINVIKCYKIVFLKLNLKYNIGFFIFVFIIFLLFLCLIIFYCRSYRKLKLLIYKIVFVIKNINKIKPLNKELNNININKNKKNLFKNIKQRFIKTTTNPSYLKIRTNLINKHSPPLKFMKTAKKENSKIFKSNIINSAKYKFNKGKNNKNYKDNFKSNKYLEYKRILEYNDYEKNELKYVEALKYDKRSFCQYYYGLLKIKNLLMFSFFPNRDYNSRIIKIYLFFSYYFINLTINALFFDDDSMHKIYKDKGKFDFIYEIPKIVLSSLISTIVNSFLSYLSLSEKNIIQIKNLKNKNGKKGKNVDLVGKTIWNKIKCKFVVFFFISFVIIGTFGFYISCFCGVYKNTQIHLIKDCSFSFGLSLVTPFIINLLPGTLRIPSLRAKKGNKNLMYKLSTIIQ